MQMRSILAGVASAFGLHRAVFDMEPIGEEAADGPANGIRARPFRERHSQGGDR